MQSSKASTAAIAARRGPRWVASARVSNVNAAAAASAIVATTPPQPSVS